MVCIHYHVDISSYSYISAYSLQQLHLSMIYTNSIFSEAKGTGKETKRDVLMMKFWERMKDEMVSNALYNFMVEHDFDTDCIDIDVDIFSVEQTSNLFGAMRENMEAMNRFMIVLRHQKILNTSFATGLPLVYWKWYQNATKQDLSGNYTLSTMNFGGFSGKELSVIPRFKNLKEEVIATGLISPEIFEKNVVGKAARYLKTKRCRKMKSTGPQGEGDVLHFDIPKDTPLSPEHLQAIVLYCDFTKLCTLFSESLRKNKWDDGLKEIKTRNGLFFYFSKFLRELVTYFGSDGGYCGGAMNGVVKGPFFSGVSVVLSVGEFSIGFNTPTSTSKTLAIAWRFAGEEGMVLTVGNQKGVSWRQPLLNATWISSFVEEDEYLWFGSIYKLSVDNITNVASSRSYRQSIAALYLLDAALTGQYMGKMEVKKEDIEILDFCIKHALNQELPPKPKYVDEYVLNCVYSFCQNKSKMVVFPYCMQNDDIFLKELIFPKFLKTKTVPEDNTNIIKPILFKLFPNLVEVELKNDDYAMNLLSLLSVLAECAISDSFKALKVRDGKAKWMKKALDSIGDIKEQYGAMGWNIEYKQMGYYDWIFITKSK